ncbi:MAG: helix-turn-helix domain-containing protein [Thermoproteus sp.]
MLRLTPTAKLVINYMALRHLVDGARYVTFRELVERLGVSERRLRSVVQELRRAGLVEAYLDPSKGRAILYKLSFNNFEFDAPRVRTGLYYIDLPPDAKIPGDLTFKAYSIIRASRLLLYTQTFASRKELFRLTKCTCSIKRYGEESLTEALEVARSGGIAAVVFSSAVDEVDVVGKSLYRRRI